MTVFSGTPHHPITSGWDEICGFKNSSEAMAARMQEELNAFQELSVEKIDLDLLDGQYRTTHPMSDQDMALTIVNAISKWVERCLAQGLEPHIVVPAGAGLVGSTGARTRFLEEAAEPIRAPVRTNPLISRMKSAKHRLFVWNKRKSQQRGLVQNSDHLIVRDVVLDSFLARADVQVILYEELPYLWHRSADYVLAHVSQAYPHIQAEPFQIPITQVAKQHAISAYQSQLRPLDPKHRRLESPSQIPERERYWHLRKS